MVWFGPRRIRERKSTAYDTDIVEPLRAIGRLTLNAEVIDDRSSNTTNQTGWEKPWSGKKRTSRNPPSAIVPDTYIRAASGSSFMTLSWDTQSARNRASLCKISACLELC